MDTMLWLTDAQVTAWGAVAVALISGWVAMRNRKTAPYEALAERVSALEAKVAELEGMLASSQTMRQRWGNWGAVMERLMRHNAPGVETPPPPEPFPMSTPPMEETHD